MAYTYAVSHTHIKSHDFAENNIDFCFMTRQVDFGLLSLNPLLEEYGFDVFSRFGLSNVATQFSYQFVSVCQYIKWIFSYCHFIISLLMFNQHVTEQLLSK